MTFKEILKHIRKRIAELAALQIDAKDVLRHPHDLTTPPVQSAAEYRAVQISAWHNYSLELRGKLDVKNPQHGNAYSHEVACFKGDRANDERLEKLALAKQAFLDKIALAVPELVGATLTR